MSDQQPATTYSLRRKTAAWSVHLFTATGAICGLMSIKAIYYEEWRVAFLWMAAAVLVDGLDGALARLVRVKDVLPTFDGTLLDNVIDYLNYVIVPALLIYWMGLVPTDLPLIPQLDLAMIVAAAMALSSAYQFCQGDAKTHDHYFKGFPSYWNIVVFYLAVLGLGAWGNLALIVVLVVLVFVPLKYIYPTRTFRWQRTTLILTTLWGIAIFAILWQYPAPDAWLIWASLAYVVYYFAASAAINLRQWLIHREQRAAA